MFLYKKNDFNVNPAFIISHQNTLRMRDGFIYYDVCPIVDLSVGWDEIIQKKKKKFKYNIKRDIRLIDSEWGKISFRAYYDLDSDFNDIFDDILGLYEARWSMSFNRSPILRPQGKKSYKNALKNLIINSDACFHLLYFDGELVSFSVGLISDRIYSVFLHSTKRNIEFMNISIGKVFFYFLIQDLIKDGFLVLDFMIGDDYYKRHWSSNYLFCYRKVSKQKGLTCGLFFFFKVFWIRIIFFFRKAKLVRHLLNFMSFVYFKVRNY